MRFAGQLGLVWVSMSVLGAGLAPATAQETNQIEQLRKDLAQLQENFRKVQEQQRQQIEALQRQLEALKPTSAELNVPAGVPAATAPPPGPPASPTPPDSPAPWSPTAPITLMGGQQNYLNLSLDGLVAAGTSTANDLERLELGGHDPKQRGFTLQNLEAVFDGKVDPYFAGKPMSSYRLTRTGRPILKRKRPI